MRTLFLPHVVPFINFNEDEERVFYQDYETLPLVLARTWRLTEHPTMKPVDLISYPILNSSRNDDIVLDTFGGVCPRRKYSQRNCATMNAI